LCDYIINWVSDTCVTLLKPDRAKPTDHLATMPWVHEDLTTEAEVMKHFPAAKIYAGTDAGFNKFRQNTKWDSYDPFSKGTGGAAWRLENAGGPIKIYSKSAGPYSRGRAFTRDALTWFGDGMIQMSLPYHPGSHTAHEYMVPKGDDKTHRIRVVIQFWVSDNLKECIRFDLGWFRPVRKWIQGAFWKVLLVKIGSELIEKINVMIQTTIQTSQKEITVLKKKHDKEIADKDEKIKDLIEQVASLSTQNQKLKGSNKRLRDSLNETKGELEEAKAQLKKKQDEDSGTSRDAIMISRLKQNYKALEKEYKALQEECRKKDKELIESRDDNLRTQVMHDDNLSFKPPLEYCKQARRVKCPRGE
jgi:hypothetical protein